MVVCDVSVRPSPKKSQEDFEFVSIHCFTQIFNLDLFSCYVFFFDFEVTCVSYVNHSRANGPFSANPVQRSYTLEGEAKSDQLCVPAISWSQWRWSGWWFQTSLFSPVFGEDSHFDSYFSNGLKPPTSDVHWPWGSSFLLFSSWLVPPIEFLNCMAFTVPNSPVY